MTSDFHIGLEVIGKLVAQNAKRLKIYGQVLLYFNSLALEWIRWIHLGKYGNYFIFVFGEKIRNRIQKKINYKYTYCKVYRSSS